MFAAASPSPEPSSHAQPESGSATMSSWNEFQQLVLRASRRERIDLIRNGVAASLIGDLAREFRCTHDDLCAMTVVSPACVRRLAAEGGLLNASSTERLARLARTEQLATTAFGSRDAARAWLKLAHPWLEGRTPLSILDTEEGGILIEQALAVLLFGDPA